MSTLYVKVYKGCPVPTVLWSLISLIGVFAGICGFAGLYFVFFPTEETNVEFVRMAAIIGIPVFILALIARKFVEKLGEKQLAERQNRESK